MEVVKNIIGKLANLRKQIIDIRYQLLGKVESRVRESRLKLCYNMAGFTTQTDPEWEELLPLFCQAVGRLEGVISWLNRVEEFRVSSQAHMAGNELRRFIRWWQGQRDKRVFGADQLHPMGHLIGVLDQGMKYLRDLERVLPAPPAG